jgi:hypothetical protein
MVRRLATASKPGHCGLHSTALEEANLPGGLFALLAALRHIAEAQGMACAAEKAGMPRESLYRALRSTLETTPPKAALCSNRMTIKTNDSPSYGMPSVPAIWHR